MTLSNNRFKYNGGTLTCKRDIANYFNNFFVIVASNLAKQIPDTNTDPASFLKEHYLHSFYFHPVVEE